MLELARRSLYLAGGGRRWRWTLVVALAVTVSLFETIGAGLIFGLLSLVASPSDEVDLPLLGDVRSALGGDEARILTIAATVVAAFFLLRALVVIGAAYVQARVTQNAGARLSVRLHAGYLRMPYAIYTATNSSTHIRNINDTVQRVVADVFVQGARLVSEAAVMLALVILLVVTSPMATALLVFVMLPSVLAVNRYVQPRLTTLGVEAQTLGGSTLRLLQESLHGLRDIRMVDREQHFGSRYARARFALAHNRQTRTVLQQIPLVAVETSLVLFISGLLVLAIATGDSAAQVLPVLGMFAYVGLRLKPSLNQLLTSMNGLRYTQASINDLYEDLKRAEAWLASPPAKGELTFARDIALDHVSFRYGGAERPALRDVQFRIARGSSVGIVGPTGGGKSTLIDVLIGLLEPDEGQVLVDGVDIRTAKSAWLGRLGVVPQTIFLLDDSLRRNIALGDEDGAVDEQRLQSALACAQLLSFVDALPDGLDTPLGEAGVRVSGGERQRIGIARALYRQPDVLVLDEGTSALDNRTEAELIAAIDALRGSYTLVIVAHRLSTVERCDQVHVLEGGRLVSSGTYEQLLASSESFQRLTLG
jgi:ABC-type multidrug transport system fused ATPase/permease subunit